MNDMMADMMEEGILEALKGEADMLDTALSAIRIQDMTRMKPGEAG